MHIYKAYIFCILFVLIIAYIFLSDNKSKNAVNRYYRVMLYFAVLHLCMDTASIYTTTHLDRIHWLVNRLVHTFSLFSMLALFLIVYKFLLALIESEMGQAVKKQKYDKIPFFVTGVGIVFLPIYYNTEKIYSYGPAVYMVYGTVVIYIALIVKNLVQYNKKLSSKNVTALRLALVVEGVVALWQLIFQGSKVSGFGVAVLMLGFFLVAENPDALLAKELLEANKKADAANNAKTEFLAHMSHEIRTPINAILGMNEMIIRESGETHIREYAKEVKGSAKSLLGIINDILDITKVEAGKLDIVPVEYQLANLLTDVYNMVSIKAAEKNLDFQIIPGEDLPSGLVGDDIRVKQILVNLLNNAVKYTHRGSVTLTVKRQDANSLFFAVSDTGIGIKKEDVDRLLLPFERMDETRNHYIEGSGLGLSITAKLLVLQGSKLKVESEYGRGSTFSFVLTQKIIDDTPLKGDFMQREQQEENYRPIGEWSQRKVLVVDDNRMNRLVLEKLLKETKVIIDNAESGFVCLEKTSTTHYDLILMDHMMPDMDGIETFRKIREDSANMCHETPVIIVTANAIVGDREKYLAMGFDNYLSKPILPNELEKVMAEVL